MKVGKVGKVGKVRKVGNHVWGPPGARVMSIFIKTYVFGKVELGETQG